MLIKFQNETIVNFQAGEDLKNNDIYIVDPNTRKIRKPRNTNEWLTYQLVYVNNINWENNVNENWTIKKDELCRCWTSY